jgi:hypothetical protein
MGTLLVRISTVPWFEVRSADRIQGGSWNCTVIESIIFPGSLRIPTSTLILHVPAPDVSCGFTYIGVLFNFLTLYEGEKVVYIINTHTMGTNWQIIKCSCPCFSKYTYVAHIKILFLSTPVTYLSQIAKKYSRSPLKKLRKNAFIYPQQHTPVTHELKLSIRRHKWQNLMGLPRSKPNARMESHIIQDGRICKGKSQIRKTW